MSSSCKNIELVNTYHGGLKNQYFLAIYGNFRPKCPQKCLHNNDLKLNIMLPMFSYCYEYIPNIKSTDRRIT